MLRIHQQVIGLLQTNYFNAFHIQTRNTVILKRKFPMRLLKIGGPPKTVKGRERIYEVVESTSCVKKPDMKVILTTFVEGYGSRGDIISVRPYIGRIKLILPGLATYASEENIAMFEEERKAGLLPPSIPCSRYMSENQKYLSTHIFPVEMNMEEPWTIEPWHIKIAFRKMGFVVPEHTIEMPKTAITGPDSEKENKEFAVYVTINGMRRFPVRCRIRHWSANPKLMTEITPEWYTEPGIPLLKEQEDLLSSMGPPEPHEL
ncbi:large ribosomal subunit protein bL9m [Centruroides vittatus]|uniref:large ribosomal subunit protein bL9m n=1 Tax=Centruroides vittatus TaxID=120091 RepID=UPI00350F63B1